MSRPRAVIFDLGGVLITSPLKAIEEYEEENDLPKGYLNYAMSSFSHYVFADSRSRAEPNAWAALEKGILKPDEIFYTLWNQNLSSLEAWEEFHRIRGI